MPRDQYFRAGVGLLVIDDSGYVLALERIDEPNSWQLPQGGLLTGEEPLDAARRELREETGIDWSQVTVVDAYPEWLAYELPPEARSPKTGRGQVQHWVLLRVNRAELSVDLDAGPHQEFSAWRWLTIDEVVAGAWEIRRPIYRRIAKRWASHFA